MKANRMTPARRQLIQMAAGLMETELDDDAPMNRTRAEVLASGVQDDHLLRSHRAVNPSARLPLVKPAKVQETVQTVLGVELTDEDIRVIVLRLCLGSLGPLNHMDSMRICAYGTLAAVCCRPHLVEFHHMDRSTGAIHDVLLYGPSQIPSARLRLDACMAHLEGRESPTDGRYRVTPCTPAMAYRASESVQGELFA